VIQANPYVGIQGVNPYLKGHEVTPDEWSKISGILKDQRTRLNTLYQITTEKGERIPFKMNRAQEILYLNMWYNNIVLKARQFGITTYECLFGLDLCMFNSNTHALIIAHNREDAEEFFHNKIRFAYNHLHPKLQDMVKADTRRAGQMRFDNGSSIRVATSGRSGTYQMVHVSEFGKICAKYPEKATEIVSGSLNTVHVGQIVSIESTAEGREGYFYDWCDEAEKIHLDPNSHLSKMDFRFFFFPWYQNPLNWLDPDGVVIPPYIRDYFTELKGKHGIQVNAGQMAWYTKKIGKMGEELMWREHPSISEECFYAAIKGSYFKEEIKQARIEGRICKVPFNPNYMVHTFWDLGVNDTNSIWFIQSVGREIRVIDYYQNSDVGLLHYAKKLDEKREEFGYRYGKWIAPHDMMVREYTTGKTRLETARGMGITFEVASRTSKQYQIESTRAILPYCVFDKEMCDDGLKCLESYQKEWNDKTGAYKNTPLHNWASNGADAFMLIGIHHNFEDAGWYRGKDTTDLKMKSRMKAKSKGWT
jgi:hypothetical protein